MKITIQDFCIRHFTIEDAPSIAHYADNRKIWKNLRDLFPHPYSTEDARVFLSSISAAEPVTVFAIADEKEAIGSIGLMMQEDVHRFSAELGYWIGEPFWNRGIMSEVVRQFVDFSFEKFHLNRIFAEPYTINQASARVLEKAGFTLEGVMHANVYKDGKILDQYLYAKIAPMLAAQVHTEKKMQQN